MLVLGKIFAILVVLVIVTWQASMYYSIVVAGSYMYNAPTHLQLITGGLWPIAVVMLALWLIRAIVRFNPSDLS